MKLIQRTYRMTVLWLIPAILLGSIFCFYMIEYIAYEETDEFLTYEMRRIIDHHQRYGQLPEFHQASAIQEGIHYPEPQFRDTLILEPGDNEMVPHRELHFSIRHKGVDFGIVLRHLLLGHDDIAFGTLLIIVGLIILIALLIFVMVNTVTQSIWKPFDSTLRKLTAFHIQDPVPSFPETSIDEFNTLHAALTDLLKKNTDAYRHTKEFNTNAAHELQTQLSVIRTSCEALMNTLPQDDSSFHQLHKIHEAAIRLSQTQKSLLLLSRISNQEFSNPVPVEMAEVIRRALTPFAEVAALRSIRVDTALTTCMVRIDPGLADILVNNLIKNGVKHNIDNGYLTIRLDANELQIENSGLPYEGNPEALLERFARGSHGNSGIGLAIVREICELYRFRLSYTIDQLTTHKIRISFS